jgi:hypothetical protein
MITRRIVDYKALHTGNQIYKILIDTNQLLYFIATEVDFMSIEDAIAQTYEDTNNGRPSIPIDMICKIMFLKHYSQLSDEDITKRCKTDMLFKFFLGLNPLDDIMDASTLTKLRRKHLVKINLINKIIALSLSVAEKNNIHLSPHIIMDSTHTCSLYNYKTRADCLIDLSKKIRSFAYDIDSNYHATFPKTPEDKDDNNWFDYCKKLINYIENDEKIKVLYSNSEKYKYLKEIIDDGLENLKDVAQIDADAKQGRKNNKTSFFGYKSHIAIESENSLIVACSVTNGAASDYIASFDLITQILNNGLTFTSLTGDHAYCGEKLINLCNEKKIMLVSMPTHNYQEHEENPLFQFNKDANAYQCPSQLSTKPQIIKEKNGSIKNRYVFDTIICQNCPHKEKCKYTGGDSKSYTKTEKTYAILEEHLSLNSTNEYKLLSGDRYKIESINANMKNNIGYDEAIYKGDVGMNIQAAFTILISNLKKVYKKQITIKSK